MVLWSIVELTITTVSTYNMVKGMYNMYCDAEKLKQEYRNHQHSVNEYLRTINKTDIKITESQYHRVEGEFMILEKSQLLNI